MTPSSLFNPATEVFGQKTVQSSTDEISIIILEVLMSCRRANRFYDLKMRNCIIHVSISYYIATSG